MRVKVSERNEMNDAFCKGFNLENRGIPIGLILQEARKANRDQFGQRIPGKRGQILKSSNTTKMLLQRETVCLVPSLTRYIGLGNKRHCANDYVP